MAVTVVVFGLFTPTEVSSQTSICPNSSIKCDVTFDHPDHGEITVSSEKGKDDSAVIIE